MDTDSDLFAAPRVYRAPRNDTKSNAKCPICGAAVFFYKLENNGRVFFDNIGPPWPKHPCTDKLSEFNAGVRGNDSEKWPLVECMEVKAENENILCLSGKVLVKNLLVFVRSDAFVDMPDPALLLRESFIQARFHQDGRVDLALLTPTLRPMLIAGYSTATDAQRGKA